MVGASLGQYVLTGHLGEGGMGVVYEARDTRLERQVAIKLLRPDAIDRDGLARLEREAKLLASLNHPNIAAIYGLDHEGAHTFLVLELVPGPTLQNRLSARGVPVREVVAICRQIACALDAAHEKGIIHRDLKPANVKVTDDGTVKVLDFGLAKSLRAAAVAADVTTSATVSADVSEAGIILGTPAYMSPEQACGRPVDRRTDIWAFGCILYELLAGRRPFRGETLTEVLAAVLEREPEWQALPSSTPPALRRLVHRCLEKDPRDRLRDIGDARLELDDAFTARGDDPAQARGPVVTRRTAIGTLLGAAAGVAGASVFATRRDAVGVSRDIARFPVTLPDGMHFEPSHNKRVAISRDGRFLAFNAAGAGGGALLVRTLRDLQMAPPGEGVRAGIPFFSPDGLWLGYLDSTAGGVVRKIAMSGGAPVTICRSEAFSGATWATADTIFFVPATPGGVARISADGGAPVEVTKVDLAAGERLHKYPHALPDGSTLLLTVATADAESFDEASIVAMSTETGQRRVIVEGGTCPCYSPSGHLVYARGGNLLAVAFDASAQKVNGRPFAALEGVQMSRNTGAANYDISLTGDLIYVPGTADGGSRTLTWVSRDGTTEKLPLPARSYLHPRISPDGRRLAIEIEGASHDVYVYDFNSGVLTNMTTNGVSHWPIWSPDGDWIGYRSGPMGRFQLWQIRADRSRPAERLQASGVSQSTGSYSPDGRAMVYTQIEPGAPSKIAVVSLEGDAAPRPLDETRFAQGSPKFSPGGQWVAYCSNESGALQVYVQAFPGPGAKIQVSNDGGTDPVWRRDGAELFYRSGDSMMAVSMATGGTLSASRPQELWKGKYSHGMSSSCGLPGLSSSNYDVTPDGQRFLMINDDDPATTRSRDVVVVQNWADELKRISSRS